MVRRAAGSRWSSTSIGPGAATSWAGSGSPRTRSAIPDISAGAPPFALRVECAGKIIAYTGDTEWTDSLIAAADRAPTCCGAPPFALRVECAGKIIAYTGDTEWTDSLIADLLVAEAYFYDNPVKFHLDYRTLMDHLSELRPKRLIVTHMSADMLARLETLDCEAAEDGMVVRL